MESDCKCIIRLRVSLIQLLGLILKSTRAYEGGRLSAIPETNELFKLFKTTFTNFNYQANLEIMRNIINKYVAGTFYVLASCVKP